MKQWYETLFENYAEGYDKEPFTQGTKGECDFIERELNFDKSLKIIDVGCGTGRHAIELSKRGYSVTGIDLSEAQLRRAREKAEKENLKVEFLRHDARCLPFEAQFDAAIMLCEGAFPLMETDEMNFEILRNVTKALKPGQVHLHHFEWPLPVVPVHGQSTASRVGNSRRRLQAPFSIRSPRGKALF